MKRTTSTNFRILTSQSAQVRSSTHSAYAAVTLELKSTTISSSSEISAEGSEAGNIETQEVWTLHVVDWETGGAEVDSATHADAFEAESILRSAGIVISSTLVPRGYYIIDASGARDPADERTVAEMIVMKLRAADNFATIVE